MPVKQEGPDGFAGVQDEERARGHEAVVAALRDARTALAELRASLER